MTARRHHWLTRLYPPAWQRRYGDEMDDLLAGGCGWREIVNIAYSAMIERWSPTVISGGDTMRISGGSFAAIYRKPSAALPIILSLAALATVLVAVSVSRFHPQTDEDAFAHIWQLLMAGQLPIVGWFAVRRLRKIPGYPLRVLGVQLVAFAAAALPVWLMGL